MSNAILINYNKLEEVRNLLLTSHNNAQKANNFIYKGNQHGHCYVKNIDEEVDNISDLFNKVSIIEESKDTINSNIIDILSQFDNNQNNETYRGLDLSSNDNIVDSPLDIDWDSLTYDEKLQWINENNIWAGEAEFIEGQTYNITNKFPNADELFYYGSYNDTYGGNQSNPASLWLYKNYYENQDGNERVKTKLQSLEKIVSNYYNFENLSAEEKDANIQNILEAYGNVGCNYMAVANSTCAYFSSIPNGEEVFKDKWGFDLCYTDNNGNKYYNTEAIAVDMCLYRFQDYSYEELLGIDNIEKKIHGVSTIDSTYIYPKYFNNKNITAESHFINLPSYNQNEIIQATKEAFQNNQFVIVVGNGYDATNLATKGDYVNKSVHINNHATLITEITENDEIMLSNWGGKYQLDSNSFNDEDDFFILQTLNLFLNEGE